MYMYRNQPGASAQEQCRSTAAPLGRRAARNVYRSRELSNAFERQQHMQSQVGRRASAKGLSWPRGRRRFHDPTQGAHEGGGGMEQMLAVQVGGAVNAHACMADARVPGSMPEIAEVRCRETRLQRPEGPASHASGRSRRPAPARVPENEGIRGIRGPGGPRGPSSLECYRRPCNSRGAGGRFVP